MMIIILMILLLNFLLIKISINIPKSIPYVIAELLPINSPMYSINITNKFGITPSILNHVKKFACNKYINMNIIIIAIFINTFFIIRKIKKIGDYSNRIDLYNLDVIDFLQNGTLRRYYKTFINFDPPYVEKGGQLYKNYFKENDHRKLRDCIIRCKRKWIVTYDVCDIVAELYANKRNGIIDIHYSANGAKQAKEFIFFSDNLIIP